MGKISVKNLAINANINEGVLIGKLKQFGINVKTKEDMVDDSLLAKLKSTKVETAEQPHIIRRKVKVVTTDERGNEVEKITTNTGGNIQKTKIVHQNNTNSEYSKEGLGVVRSNRRQNTMAGIVVTKNGQKLNDDVVKNTSVNEDIVVKAEQEPQIQTVNNVSENVVKNTEPKVEQVAQQTPKEFDTPKIQQIQRPQGNNMNTQRNYNQNQREYGTKNYDRNDNKQYPNNRNRDNRNYSSNGNNNGYSNNSNNGYRKDFNNKERFDNRRQGPYNPNNRPQQRDGQNGIRKDTRPNRPGFNRPNFVNKSNNADYKVNKFMKSTINDTIQKETRDYSTALIDKKKYNEDRNQNETKRDKKNTNSIREQNTRVAFNKIKGMQVSEDGLMDLYDRGENRGYSKKRKTKIVLNATKIIPLTEVELPEVMSVKYFAEIVKKQASEIVKKLFSLGILATINQDIDFDTAYLIAQEFGITAKKEVIVTEEDKLFDDSEDEMNLLTTRPPIVTIMGHVDHGKTSLLDKIRESKVVQGEFGGITQHIGAYKVNVNGKEITFLDTPGHEAFSEMRARGAQVTDIVVIVVAADDSIKPQTIEAINHAKLANVPIVVAINKIDKTGANIEKVKQDLMEYDLVAEEWGGNIICVPVSAKTGEGIDTLLEMILLVADVQDLKANPDKQAKGTVIEAKLDQTKGALATVIVQRGTLNVGDTIVLGDIVGKIRVMTNDRGEKVKEAGPSTPVEILGLGIVPEAGDIFYEVKDEKTAHKLIDKRKAEQRIELIKKGGTVTLDDLYSKIKDGELKNLDIVLRADVQGSVQALKESLEKLSNEEVRVRVIAKNTGGITESDVTLAKLSNAIIIGFNVKADNNVLSESEKQHVDLRLYTVIYDAINDITTAMKGMLKPNMVEAVCATVEVRQIFKVSSLGTIAGSYVKSGKVNRNCFARVIRGGTVINSAKIESLKRAKEDVKEVAEGYECGIKLEKYNDIQDGDILECYTMVEQVRS